MSPDATLIRSVKSRPSPLSPDSIRNANHDLVAVSTTSAQWRLHRRVEVPLAILLRSCVVLADLSSSPSSRSSAISSIQSVLSNPQRRRSFWSFASYLSRLSAERANHL